MSAEQRLADRRERLILAAYTLFANPGFHATTIERLCGTARISNRAFYECFSGREELMRAVYDRCVDETVAYTANAIERSDPALEAKIVAGLAAYIQFVTEDQRRARIMHLEVRRAGDVLSNARQRAVGEFSQMIEASLEELGEKPPLDLHLLSLALVGALQELLIEWVLADEQPPISMLIDTCVYFWRRTFLPNEP
ncbi:TetR/AcrR family transcriptional regulator [Streptosporangiaceae bacterium NEAU-GS5]|nr:TetR/AcrR family transcriptional regulator [Streptosporangiaceae bacterium NEAU-GS5]